MNIIVYGHRAHWILNWWSGVWCMTYGIWYIENTDHAVIMFTILLLFNVQYGFNIKSTARTHTWALNSSTGSTFYIHNYYYDYYGSVISFFFLLYILRLYFDDGLKFEFNKQKRNVARQRFVEIWIRVVGPMYHDVH